MCMFMLDPELVNTSTLDPLMLTYYCINCQMGKDLASCFLCHMCDRVLHALYHIIVIMHFHVLMLFSLSLNI